MASNSKSGSFQTEQLPEFLPVYYKRLFPFDLYYRWMSYGKLKKNYFVNREFSFTLKDDVYIRYQSFNDKTEFENEVIKCCPYKIDIGAVYNFKPSDRRAIASLQALEKELVFDIDMTDYDEVRTCCKETSVCQKCWPFMTVAIKILHRALVEDFGFQHIMWVFSGRRGVHCWVCDESARLLSPAARTAVVQYLSLVQGGEFKSKKVNLKGVIHPSVREALKVVNKYFPELILKNQDLLETRQQYEKIINFCSDPKLKEMLSSHFPAADTSEERWDYFLTDYTKVQKKSTKDKLLPDELMLQMCYPRLDVNVSKGLNHLLKAPFCVHPKTGQVCVPIDPNHADEFDPMSVPTVSELIGEIDSYDAKAAMEVNDEANSDKNQKIKEPDYKKTKLNNSYKLFQSFVRKMESAWSKTRVLENESKMEF